MSRKFNAILASTLALPLAAVTPAAVIADQASTKPTAAEQEASVDQTAEGARNAEADDADGEGTENSEASEVQQTPQSDDSQLADDAETGTEAIAEDTVEASNEAEPEAAIETYAAAVSVNSSTKPYSAGTISTIGGATRYETSAQQALDGWSSSEWAIVANGENCADALCSSGLAGALECPILLTNKGSVPDAVSNALKKLGVKHVLVIGGTAVIDDSVCNQLKQVVGSQDVTRLAGPTRYETQLKVYEFGSEHQLWGTSDVAVVNGETFADALSVAPLCYKLRAPIFYVNGGGNLPQAQLDQLKKGGFSNAIVAGGTAVVSSGAESSARSACSGNSVRLGGDTRYETSYKVASYSKDRGMNWDGMAVASGSSLVDALGGGALQGSRNAVLVLKDVNDTTGATVPSRTHPSKFVFFGGENVFPASYKVRIALNSGYPTSQIDGVNCSSSGNWYTINGSKYYWKGSDWAKGPTWIDAWYWFDYTTGAMQTGWVWNSGAGEWQEYGSDGKVITAHYHNVPWVGQPNNYYCGPATGTMILRGLGYNVNVYQVASAMQTDAYHYTSFNDRKFQQGMNHWLGNVYTTAYLPSYSTVRSAVVNSFRNGKATAVDEQERRGGPHFNGHNNGTFSHIMAIDGYDQSSDAVLIADPGGNGALWGGAGKFWYSSLSDFTAKYLQTDVQARYDGRQHIGIYYAN